MWERAANFIRRQALGMRAEFGASIEAPTLGPGPDGSIDVHWKTEKIEILVSIPPTGHIAHFYGDDYGDNKLSGTVDVSGFNEHLAFLLTGSRR